MPEQFKNLASTQLDGGIDDSTTTITVDSAMGFTSGDFRIRIDDEIMVVTGVSGLDFTVTRHAEGTSAAAHSDNAPVYHVLTAGGLDAHDQNDLMVRDAYASKPAAGVPGRIFLPTDGPFLEHDDGTTWRKFGPIWPLSPPKVSDFPTWVNQGDSTVVDNKGAIYFSCEDYSGISMRAVVKTYPTPPFTVEMAFMPVQHCNYGSNDVSAGLCIRDSSAGTLQVYGVNSSGANNRSAGLNYSDPTTNAGAITGWSDSGLYYHFQQNLYWIKYEDDGTYRNIYFAADGYSWIQIVNLSNTDYLTPDQIGLLASNVLAGTNARNGCTFLHWKEY